MTSRKASMKTLFSPPQSMDLEKAQILRRRRTGQIILLVGALILAGAVVTGVSKMTGNGNLTVLNQRLFGEVRLSSGIHSAGPSRNSIS